MHAGVAADLADTGLARRLFDIQGVQLIDDRLRLRDVDVGGVAGPIAADSAASATMAVTRPTTWSGKIVVAS